MDKISKILRPMRDFEPRFLQFAEELISLAEALKNGFSIGSPLSAILRALVDLNLLASSLIEEDGFRMNAPTQEGKEFSDPSDPLKYEVDELMNRLTISWKQKDELQFSENLELFFERMAEINLQVIQTRGHVPASFLNTERQQKQVVKRENTRKLTRANLFYLRRKRASHKRPQLKEKL